MAIKQTTPTAAYERLSAAKDALYLDVRTEAEFERGHPPGAFNVVVVFLDPAGGPARPNPDFVAQVQAVAAPDRELIVGCQAGGRSQRACEILAQVGYTDLTNVQGGFGGARDRAGNVIKGWRDSGLPVETGRAAPRA
jgi:rhodanese-related sulfurtransferase